MKLLLINQYYWPDYAATAQMMVDLAERLTEAGHEVHVLASRGKYDDGSGADTRLPRREIHNGVHIHRITATGFGKKRMIGRVLDYLSFHLLIGLRTLLTGWRYDAVITLTTPPLVGIYATPLRWLRLTRHVCWVMDLHPDLEFELGLFDRRKPLPRLLDWLNGMHFRHADRCVVLGSHMADRLRDKGVRDDQLVTIPVWGHDLPTEPPSREANPLRAELGLGDKFVVMYSGNAGIIHQFDEVCEAARQLRGDDRIVFLFVGSGRRMAEIEAYRDEHELSNIITRGYFPRERLAQSLTLGDVHLITLRDGMAGVAVPCKQYGIMAAGRPAIFIGPAACETAETLRDYECGEAVVSGDADRLVAVLRELQSDVDRRERMGVAARAAFERTFNAQTCVEQWRHLIEAMHRKRDDSQ